MEEVSLDVLPHFPDCTSVLALSLLDARTGKWHCCIDQRLGCP
jgi:hypothetical protein